MSSHSPSTGKLRRSTQRWAPCAVFCGLHWGCIATGQCFLYQILLPSLTNKGYHSKSIPGINLRTNLCLIVCSLELNLQLVSGVSNVAKYKLMILKTKHTFKHTKALSLLPLSLIEIYDSPSSLPSCCCSQYKQWAWPIHFPSVCFSHTHGLLHVQF